MSDRQVICDYIIKGCKIIDGTGAEAFVADVAIDQDKIVAISKDLSCYIS